MAEKPIGESLPSTRPSLTGGMVNSLTRTEIE